MDCKIVSVIGLFDDVDAAPVRTSSSMICNSRVTARFSQCGSLLLLARVLHENHRTLHPFSWSQNGITRTDEVAVVSGEKEIEFPTLESFSFIDLQLTNGKSIQHTKSNLCESSPDYEKEAKKYKKLGDRGEYVVVQAEVSRLMKELSISESKAKKLIKWVSRESDAFGYDIQSVNKDKTPRYIEVKATQREVGDLDFYYTENEYETAKKFGQYYYIYVVYEILSPHPKIWVIKNPFYDLVGIKMKPVKYKVQLSTSKK